MSGDEGLIRSPELRTIVALGLVLTALLMLALELRSRPGQSVLLDLRQWRISFQPGPEAPFEGPVDTTAEPAAAQQPFRLPLAIPRPPKSGDTISALRTVEVDPTQRYCFQVYLLSEFHRPEQPSAWQAFSVFAVANGQSSSTLRLGERRHRSLLLVEGIRPVDGRIEIGLHLRANRSFGRESWQRASRIAFEFADLWPCAGAGGGP